MAVKHHGKENRRGFLRGAAAVASMSLASRTSRAAASEEWIYIGPYTGGASEGIYRAKFEPGTGRIGEPVLAAKTTSPSFLEWHPSKKFLYAVNEVREFHGQPGGAATAFSASEDGTLQELNAVSTRGAGPCHLMCSPDGKALVVANYSAGSTTTFRITPDGKLSEAVDVIQHKGSGPNVQRQKAPHAHGVAMKPYQGKLLTYIADLGIDKVLAFELDTASAKLTPWRAQAEIPLAPGSGPRHLALHPTAPLAFVITELESTLAAFRIDPRTSIWTKTDTQNTRARNASGENYPAEVVVHPNGRFVYGSNRGDENIAIFAIDTATGKLTLRGHVSTGGRNPRSIAISRSGESLLAANQDTGNVVSFKVDADTGMPRPTGHQIRLEKPVCILFS
ncbi:MAG: lactonase family protein [Bryobacterales bacterium]|nr:lactonase family protein [Bryobacterales bacterium]